MLLYIISVDFPPLSGPGVWRMLALAKYAAKSGHRVRVFCSDRSFWNNWSDPELLKQLSDSIEVIRISSVFENDIQSRLELWQRSPSLLKKRIGAQLHWWVYRYFPDQILHWAIKVALISGWQGRRERPQAIVTSGPMHLAHLAGYMLTRLRPEVRWAMDYRDPWSGDEISAQVHPGPYQARLMAWLERKLSRRATWITTVTPGFMRYLQKTLRMENSAEKFKLIPNGHDLDVNGHAQLTEPPRPDSLRIHFNGTIQITNNAFAGFFEALSLYRKRLDTTSHPPLRCSFCGVSQHVLKQIEQWGLADWVVDYGSLSQAKSQEYSRGADILLVVVRDDLVISQGIVPAKLYEALAIGKPVLALVPDPSDVRDILAEDQGSICATPGQAAQIAVALEQLALNAQHNDIEQYQRQIVARWSIAQRYQRAALSAEFLQLLGFDVVNTDERQTHHHNA